MGRKRKQRLLEDVAIFGIADKGLAVGKDPKGEVVFIKDAVPGDIIDARIFKKRKKVGFGKVEVMKSLSPDRVDPICEHFDDCGGCKWQNLDYDAQLKHKYKVVFDAMTRIAKLDGNLMEPILGSEEIFAYRNKLEFTFASRQYIPQSIVDTSDELTFEPGLGFHVAGAWDKVLDINQCHLMDDRMNAIRNFLKSFCLEHGLEFYNLKTNEGLMRNVILRVMTTGDWMITIVFKKKDTKNIKLLLDATIEQFPYISSLNYVINGKLNDVIFDLDVVNYKGQPFITEVLGDIKYRVGPKSFFQTNTKQGIRLFDVVLDFAELTGNENVYDLYTGLGSIALYIASKVKHVTGIEEIPEAIQDAEINAQLNNIENTTFYAGDVKNILSPEFAIQHGKPDIVITDPPRAGMHADVVKTLLSLGAPKIVYVSCNPATQARDLQMLSEKYEVRRIRPVDMFPHTHHIENVALLELR